MARIRLEDASAKHAHTCLHTKQFLDELGFSLENKKIIIALSGGVDSTAVLLFLALMRPKYKLELYAVHIDHCLREESVSEALHVEKLCEQFEVPCKIIKVDIYNLAKEWKKGIEETARIVRYTHFESERKDKSFDYIALGHHLNDLAEDSLMRQIRGSGLEESVGMNALDENRRLVRPFLCTDKEILKSFVQEWKINWVEDSSNSSNDYMRNRVRNNILPLILQENPNYLAQVRNNWKQGQCDKLYWEKLIAPYLPADLDTYKLDRKKFKQEEKSLRLRILKALLLRYNSHPQAEIIFKADELICANESNKFMDASNGLKIEIQRSFVRFIRG